MPSPTQRSKAYLESRGYIVEIVERWNPWAKVRHDLYGFIDLLAVCSAGTLAVQTTTHTNVLARVKKIRESPHLRTVLDAGWKVHVHGWKKPTKKVKRWTLTVVDILASSD